MPGNRRRRTFEVSAAEPIPSGYRRIAMTSALTRALAATATSLVLASTLAACGGDSGDAVATDTGSTTSATPTPSPSPTEQPTVGTYPAYAALDYVYTLQQQCFCANIDEAYRITVEGGQVTGLTWATAGEGHEVGDALDEPYLRLTIQDIIDKANDTKAARIKVDWPAGQDYPTSVYIDQNQRIADEEVTWVISDVVPA
jgi:Family of unknown function (DUF6174)